MGASRCYRCAHITARFGTFINHAPTPPYHPIRPLCGILQPECRIVQTGGRRTTARYTVLRSRGDRPTMRRMDWRSEMVEAARQFESPTRFENTPSCGLGSQGSSPRSSRSLANLLQAYLAPANRRRCHGRIRRVVRKGWLLTDNGAPITGWSSRVVGWRSGSCAGRMSADASKYIRRCYIKPLKFVQYTEVISVNLCSMETGNDINSLTSLHTEIKTYKICYTKRKSLDYIAAWRELCYTVAQKELLYA